jgi:1-acyl-sn-glycerol-3-phosphate acyltransferase
MQKKRSNNILLDWIFPAAWAVWGLLLFISSMFVAFVFYIPCYIIKEPHAGRWHRKVSRVWMTFFLYLIGCPFKIKGVENFQKGKNYVIVCNHNSLIDVPITTPFMPRANKTIAKTSFAYIPIFGWIYSAGSVLVDRKNDKSRKESFQKMKRALERGFDMVIYPEGTRNRTGDPLKSFYDGAFKLAVDTGNAIMPALLFNTAKVLPVNKPFYLSPHKLEMHFLPPIDSSNISSRELKNKVFKIMWDYLEANKNNV